MRIRLVLLVPFLTAQIAAAGVFQLPKDNPRFSVEFSDKWQTELEGDAVTARGSKESKAIFAVVPAASAKTLEEALTFAAEQFKKDYTDFALDKPSPQKGAGMDILGAPGKAKKDGVDVRLAIFSFSPDGQRYFAITWACAAWNQAYGTEIDRTLNSLKSFKEAPQTTKEKGG